MHPYRSATPPVKINRTRARIRGFCRRILYPTMFVCGVGMWWTACNTHRSSKLDEKEAALATAPITVPVPPPASVAPEPPKPPPPTEGMFYETTSALNGVEISRVFDSKTKTTCYVVNDQKHYDTMAVGVSCVK